MNLTFSDSVNEPFFFPLHDTFQFPVHFLIIIQQQKKYLFSLSMTRSSFFFLLNFPLFSGHIQMFFALHPDPLLFLIHVSYLYPDSFGRWFFLILFPFSFIIFINFSLILPSLFLLLLPYPFFLYYI